MLQDSLVLKAHSFKFHRGGVGGWGRVGGEGEGERGRGGEGERGRGGGGRGVRWEENCGRKLEMAFEKLAL